MPSPKHNQPTQKQTENKEPEQKPSGIVWERLAHVVESCIVDCCEHYASYHTPALKGIPMRAFALVIVAALGLGGCVTFAELRQDAEAVMAAYHRGEAIAESTVRKTVATTCGELLPIANAQAMNLRNTFSNPGPKTAAGMRTVDRYLNVAMAACDEYSRNPSGAGLFALGIRLFDAYKAGRAALAQTQAAGGA